MEDLLKAVGQFGFPIAVSCYLLFRMERTMGQLRDAILKLLSDRKDPL